MRAQVNILPAKIPQIAKQRGLPVIVRQQGEAPQMDAMRAGYPLIKWQFLQLSADLGFADTAIAEDKNLHFTIAGLAAGQDAFLPGEDPVEAGGAGVVIPAPNVGKLLGGIVQGFRFQLLQIGQLMDEARGGKARKGNCTLSVVAWEKIVMSLGSSERCLNGASPVAGDWVLSKGRQVTDLLAPAQIKLLETGNLSEGR